jgi:hypothetical protein
MEEDLPQVVEGRPPEVRDRALAVRDLLPVGARGRRKEE